jgi:hypothetical protein
MSPWQSQNHSPADHGMSVREAAMLIGVPEGTIRIWLHRGVNIRSQDGRIDYFLIQEWWDDGRSARGNRTTETASKRNPYAHPAAPSATPRPTKQRRKSA